MNRFLISAAHKSSGKTIVSVGLAAALRQRGLSVVSFKKGPDYIDPMWLGQASGSPCWNLDFFTMHSDEITACYRRRSHGADVALVEGNKGLHDGLDVEGGDSNAALAKQLDLPVVLVIDVTGITRGIAPLLTGYTAFDPAVGIAGVILNRVAGPRQETKLRAAVERYTALPVLGAIPRLESTIIEERHLGLVPTGEQGQVQDRIQNVAYEIARCVNIDQLLHLTTTPVVAKPGLLEVGYSNPIDLRIGIARDPAFGFYYPDDLAAFAKAGVELVPFDTLRDSCLPEVEGLFIGGGFPESFLDGLSANTGMRTAVRRFIEADGPVYAECGGLMYLCRSIRWQGQRADMVGVVPADAVVKTRPVGRGYMVFNPTPHHPWPVVAASPDKEYRVHEFHYSQLENLDNRTNMVLQVKRGHGINGQFDGFVYRNLLATYAHQRHVRDNPWVDGFVDFVRACR